ncbi:MAG TPA: PAS domain-containing protein, partial [Gemmatimonadales bacterium]
MHSKALLDSLDAGVAAVAPDWTIVEWSSGAAEITGLPAHRAIGTSLWMAFPTAKGTLVEQVLQEVRGDGRPRTYLAPARTPDFTGMVFETRVTRGPRGHLVLLFRPVRQELAPESRAAQILTAFEGERLLYAQLFESLPIPALVLTVEGQILEANPEGRTLLGAVDLRALRGLPLAQWAPAAQRPAFAAVLREAVTTRQRCDFVVEFAGEPARTV